MEQKVFVGKEEGKRLCDFFSMTGDQIYKKYGVKRDETFVESVSFPDGFEMDVKLVICEGEEKPYTEAVLFEHGHEVGHTDPRETFFGKWDVPYNGVTYSTIVLEKQADELEEKSV